MKPTAPFPYIAAAVTDQCQALNRAVSVEEVQDMVENQLMDIKAHDIARHYITYRYIQSLKRQTNTTDERILSLIECQNEEVKQENANKNPTVNSVQRDYMAGEISKDLTARLLLDPEIVKAHQEGLIHFHDSDYFAQHMHNCDLVNLDDMLQNGTVISGTYIEKPHSFSTACNIATQIIAQVASNQYGGQSISLTHLAPFVDVSRKKIAAEVEAEMEGLDVSDERKREIVERRLRSEINRGVQTIQYQVVTLMTTNGQAPFITVFMYLGEARNAQEKADLAIIIEETIRQRYQGVKNEAGVWITPAFPKLIYVLEEDNIHPGDPYYYLTELAAKCTAKRMVPDYISEKKMLELKVDKNGEGHCYTCMGCRSFLTPYVDPETGKPKKDPKTMQPYTVLDDIYEIEALPETTEKEIAYKNFRREAIKPYRQMRMPQPDFVLCCNNICNCMTKWYENICRMRNIPLIMIDIPYNNTVDVHDTNVAYVRAQFDAAIHQLEELTGKKFDEKKFEHACENANRTAKAWLRVCDYLQYKPAPYSGFDLFNHMADVVTARGKVEAAEAFELLEKDLAEAVKEGKSTTPFPEKYRVMFEGIPCWPKLPNLFKPLKEHGVNVTAVVYAPAFGFVYNNMDEMARAYYKAPNSVCIEQGVDWREGICRDNKVDGVLVHYNRSCKPWSGYMAEMQRRFTKDLGVPCAGFDGDQADPRNFNEAQYATRVQGLVEAMEANQAKKEAEAK